MSIVTALNTLSFKKLIGITLLLGLFTAIPLTVWVVQQQTKTSSKAFFEKPQPIVPGKKYGSPSEGDPQVNLVWPFLGKVGDVVLIQGKNLGNNPVDKSLKVGEVVVTENEINKWTPTLIEFAIPQGSTFGPVRLKVAGKEASWPFPFTVYSLDTQPQVTENNDVVRVINPPPGAKIEIFFNDSSQMESDQVNNTVVPSDKTIISIALRDGNNQLVPFFVDPTEFGF